MLRADWSVRVVFCLQAAALIKEIRSPACVVVRTETLDDKGSIPDVTSEDIHTFCILIHLHQGQNERRRIWPWLQGGASHQ